MPFFSVVITVYNKSKFIKNTLFSVLNQSFKDFEIIVINDGSSDNSEQIIESIEDDRIKLISTTNQGASSARNRGIKEAKYDYIALLDGDDEWHTDYLKHTNDAINTFSSKKIFTAAVAQKYGKKTVPTKYALKQKELYASHNYFKASMIHTVISSSSIVFHKSILKKTGLFDEHIISGQDIDLWIRFGIHYDIVFINKVLVYYNYSETSLSNTTFDLNKKPKFDKYYDEEKNNALLKAYLNLNRYSMAILSKLQNDKSNFDFYKSNIDIKNMNLKQNILLSSPKWLLKILLNIKSLKGEKIYYPKD